MRDLTIYANDGSQINLSSEKGKIYASQNNGIKKIELEKDSECKMRLPDCTEEYYGKWTENMFLNNFDEDVEDAGVNIALWQLHQPLFYRLKGQKKDLSNLEERLNKCTGGQDPQKRMLLILGQPGMGKSTMITWFLNRYSEKPAAKKKEILVYRFTDFNIDWSFNGNGERKIWLHLDNCKVHNSKKTSEAIEQFGFKRAPHPPYSPDIAPSDFFLFGYTKTKLKE